MQNLTVALNPVNLVKHPLQTLMPLVLLLTSLVVIRLHQNQVNLMKSRLKRVTGYIFVRNATIGGDTRLISMMNKKVIRVISMPSIVLRTHSNSR